MAIQKQYSRRSSHKKHLLSNLGVEHFKVVSMHVSSDSTSIKLVKIKTGPWPFGYQAVQFSKTEKRKENLNQMTLANKNRITSCESTRGW